MSEVEKQKQRASVIRSLLETFQTEILRAQWPLNEDYSESATDRAGSLLASIKAEVLELKVPGLEE